MTLHRLLLIFGILALSSCGVSLNSGSTALPESAPLVKVKSGVKLTEPTSPVNIKYAEQAGDFLILGVSYSGGCESHQFDLISEGVFTATYPPEVDVKLMHNNNGDRCRSIVDERLYFDLTPLRYSGTNQIRLILVNTDRTVDYTY